MVRPTAAASFWMVEMVSARRSALLAPPRQGLGPIAGQPYLQVLLGRTGGQSEAVGFVEGAPGPQIAELGDELVEQSTPVQPMYAEGLLLSWLRQTRDEH